MSKSFQTPINLNQLELQNALIQNLASAPSSPKAGQIYFSTALNTILQWNGTIWVSVDPSLVPSAYIPFSRVAGIQSAINATPLSAFALPTTNVPMGGFQFSGLAAGSIAGNAMEWAQGVALIQNAAAGIISKPAAYACSTSNISSLSGLPTVDGVTLTAGQYVLLTGQTTASQNGLYAVGSSSWTRVNTDGNSELEPGATYLVLAGTAYGGTQFRVTNTSNITVGTTAVTITQYSAGTPYTAGPGLTLTNGQFAGQVMASGGILVSASGFYLDSTVATRKYATTIGDGTSTSYTVTHNLGSLDVQVQIYLVSSGATIEADVTRTSTSAVSVAFAQAPASGAYRVSVMG